MVNIFLSRYTPGLVNGAKVKFNKGEKVIFKPRHGAVVVVTIDSGRMTHEDIPEGEFVYEVIPEDTGKRCAILASQIIGWEGKC